MTRLPLNPAQRRAVEHAEGPLLVLAGAGSGKTRVLTARIARLIAERRTRPAEILAVTFTNRAAGVMRERVASLLGEEPGGLWIGTFHSVAARLLRREGHATDRGAGFTIYDEEDALRALRRAMEEAGYDPQRWSPGAIRARISDAKAHLIAPGEHAASAFDLISRAAAEVYPRYEMILRRSRAFDFDDLLLHATRLLEEEAEIGARYAGRFRHVLVDEYQDTNHAQYRIVRALAREHGNLCVVGDDDQSIYAWRGADIRNILDFERDFPGAAVVRLEENYRSTSAILEVANEVIARNRRRKEKRLYTARPGGEPVQVVRAPDERAEAIWTVERIRQMSAGRPVSEFAILYRTNAQSRPYEDALRRARLPYRIVGGVRFYERREIKDVLAYLQLAVNPADEAAFLRAVGWPRRGVGSVTLERLAAAAGARGVPLLEAANEAGRIDELPPAGARALAEFAAAIGALGEAIRETPVEEAIRMALDRFGLLAALEAEEDGADRIANVTELLAAAASFEPETVEDPAEGASPTELFLQSAALTAEIDDYEENAGAVTLMTLHNAKGLEFPVVFIGGLEEGLLPLSRASETDEGVEEERRLFYVGVTRAQDRLFLTHADRRWRAGSQSRSDPSSFLDELPAEGVERRRVGSKHAGLRRDARAPVAGGERAWGGGDGPGAAGFPWRARGRVGGSAGVRYDFEDTQVPLEVRPGARVAHPRFGEGTVVAVSGRGREVRAEIDFDEAGRRKVVVAYAGLRPV